MTSKAMLREINEIVGNKSTLNAEETARLRRILFSGLTEKAKPEARCDKSDLFVSQCAHCKGYADQPDIEDLDLKIVLTFEARYEGKCSVCKKRFYPGMLIHKTDEDYYVGSCCVEVN